MGMQSTELFDRGKWRGKERERRRASGERSAYLGNPVNDSA